MPILSCPKKANPIYKGIPSNPGKYSKLGLYTNKFYLKHIALQYTFKSKNTFLCGKEPVWNVTNEQYISLTEEYFVVGKIYNKQSKPEIKVKENYNQEWISYSK